LIHLHRFAACDVLRVVQRPYGTLGVPFLDLAVSSGSTRGRPVPDENLTGCGLYGVCFRGKLIYLGSYCGGKRKRSEPKRATFNGDVAEERWSKHFGAITARDCRLFVSPGPLRTLVNEIGPGHRLLASLAAAAPAIHDQRGCLGPENRLRFAARRWAQFEHANAAELLRQFSFVYARVDRGGLARADPRQLMVLIENVEKEAIRELAPECNTKGRPRGAVAKRLSARVALRDFERRLINRLDGQA
jgi:hypothetical protein